ncbi:MAG TPA: transcriptional regulator, partial [Mucilaginibacter sp.]
MTVKPIKTEADYQQALERLELIFDAEKGSEEGDELVVLGILIEKYENEHFPIDLPDPIEAIKFRMD